MRIIQATPLSADGHSRQKRESGALTKSSSGYGFSRRLGLEPGVWHRTGVGGEGEEEVKVILNDLARERPAWAI